MSVKIFDTPGIVSDAIDTKVLDLIKNEVLAINSNGVLFVSVSMQDRLSEAISEDLYISCLSSKFKTKIWKYKVVVLTKADQYNEEVYLQEFKRSKEKNESTFFKKRFQYEIDVWKMNCCWYKH